MQLISAELAQIPPRIARGKKATSTMSGEKRKGGFDWGKQVKAGRGAPIEIGDTEFSFTAHACIARNNQPSGNFLGIIGVPKSVKLQISAGAIKDKLEKTIAEALLYDTTSPSRTRRTTSPDGTSTSCRLHISIR